MAKHSLQEPSLQARIPETRKKPGVSYAVSDDGLELPVIDITHPSFAAVPSEAELEALTRAFIAQTERRERAPWFLKPVLRLLLKQGLRKSVLAQGLQSARGSFLAGMSTYLFKLGPDHLGAYASAIDKHIVASLAGVSMQLRLKDVARLLADGLAPVLEARPSRPAVFVNLGGGPCIDSLNALLLLRRERPELLASRRVAIAAFDLETRGASFGARALASLREPGAPLHGLDVTLLQVTYDWARPETLSQKLEPLRVSDSIVAISSEGALFEYASDEHVVANLAELKARVPPDAIAAGSATSDGETSMLLQRTSPARLQPRSVAALEALVARAGWRVIRVIDRPLSRDFQLVRMT